MRVAELQRECGVDAENRTVATLGSYFGVRRGHNSMEPYISMSELASDEARTEGRLQMDNVGRSWFLLQGSGLQGSQINDHKLRIDGDLHRD